MSKMRTILKALMDHAGHNAHDVFRRTGIQPSTIYRYFASNKSDLKPETTKKLARLYGITESQLRGDVPIDGMETPKEQLSLKDLLTLDEYRLMNNVKVMDSEAKDILYRIAERLAEPQAVYYGPYDRRLDDRRRANYSTQLRIAESEMYNPPLVQRRLKDQDEQKNGGKNTRTA